METQTPPRKLRWVGDSKERLLELPKHVQYALGRVLGYAQFGATHPHAKPCKGIASGVFEIVERFQTDTYRAVYAVQIGEHIYVLHAFQKKSKQGIKTPKQDVEMIKRRYREAVAWEKQQ